MGEEGLTGRVELLHISPARGIDMRSVDSIEVRSGHGIEGDRYCNSKHRHISVQSIEDLAAASADFGADIAPELTRRNVTVSGIAVPTSPGTRLQLADAVLEVVRIAAPCHLLDDDIGDGARIALRRRAGTIFRVLTGAQIALGDPVTLAE